MTDEEETTMEEAPEEASPDHEVQIRYVSLEEILGFTEEETKPLINPVLTTWNRYYEKKGQRVSIYDRPTKGIITHHFKTREEREACLKGFLSVDLMLYHDSHEVKGVPVDPQKWKTQLLRHGYPPAPAFTVPLAKVAALGVAGLEILSSPDQPNITKDERLKRLTEAWLTTREEKLAFLAGWIIQGGIFNAYQRMAAQQEEMRRKYAQAQQQGGAKS